MANYITFQIHNGNHKYPNINKICQLWKKAGFGGIMELWYAKWEIDIIIKQGWSGL